jgi:hypothetical protein
MAPTSSLTQRERDNLHEQTVEALLDHEAESSRRQEGLTTRLDRIEATQQRILDALNLGNTSIWGVILRLIDRATASTIGTVALLSLIAVALLIGASVYLGADHVLAIVAGRVSLGAPLPPTETP